MKMIRSLIRSTFAAGGLCLLLGAGACAFDQPREPQPEGLLRLPGALTTSADGRFLYVVGTNFDLTYGTGALQSFELAAFDTKIAEAQVWPVRLDPSLALKGEVQIGSFGGLVARGVLADGRERLFVPMRGTGAVAAVDVGESGALSCVLQGASAAEIGTACDRTEVALTLGDGGTIDDPFAAVAVGDRLWVGSLSAQVLDPEDPESELATYFARLGVESPGTPEILRSSRMMPREFRVGPAGKIWAVGQVFAGSASLAELRVYDPASFELGVEGVETFAISGAAGGGEARGLRFSTNGEFIYVITRLPSRLLAFERRGSFGNESLSLRGAVALPTTPAALELFPGPTGDLIAITGNLPDALVIVDSELLEIVGLLDGTHCDAAGICPRGSRTVGSRVVGRDPGERPFGITATPVGNGIRLWITAFGLEANAGGGLLAVDLSDLGRPWELGVVAEVTSPDPEEEL